MNFTKRNFIKLTTLSTTSLLLSSYKSFFTQEELNDYYVPKSLKDEMYQKALKIAKSKIRGGINDTIYKKPFVDAAFSSNIFYWDTCFIACYAKYHQAELPITNALDNFYQLMEPDGFICREYTKEGKPMWPKEHPVSMNPPLLAFAELELYSIHLDKNRLIAVYPYLKKHFEYWIKTYKCDDNLFFNDAFGSGMDNIERFPHNWTDDKKGIPMRNLYPEIFVYDGISPNWNKQGRMVDVSAQMALFALNLIEIAGLINKNEDIKNYKSFYTETKEAINKLCWNDEDAFYYDLGYSQQIKRKHVGMFWVLIAGIVPENKMSKFMAHLKNPKEFWRKIPISSLSADEKEFSPLGDYWKGSVWVPTNYIILKGLRKYNQEKIANKLAKQYYWSVSEVYKKTKTFWENYSPDFIDKGNQARPDFCGWTGIVPITIYREFL